MPLTVQVVTPEREVVVADDATFVLAHGIEGDVGILPGHAPLLIALGVGPLRIDRGESKQHLAVDGGFLQVANDNLIVLAEHVTLPDEVDRETVSAEIADLERALQASPDGEDTRARLSRARAVLRMLEEM